MRYQVVLESGPTSVGAYVPDLPGCVAVGATREVALQLIREGIELHVGELRDSGQPVLSAGVRLEIVDIDAA